MSLADTEIMPGAELEINYALAVGLNKKAAYEAALDILNGDEAAVCVRDKGGAGMLDSTISFLSKLIYPRKRIEVQYDAGKKTDKSILWKYGCSRPDLPIAIFDAEKYFKAIGHGGHFYQENPVVHELCV